MQTTRRMQEDRPPTKRLIEIRRKFENADAKRKKLLNESRQLGKEIKGIKSELADAMRAEGQHSIELTDGRTMSIEITVNVE